MAGKRKFYVVWEGRATGVFDSWDECQLYVEHYPNARYKSFDTQEEAVAAFRGDTADHLDILKAISEGPATILDYSAFSEIRLDALAVDAACSKNPGPVEYRGVWVRTGQQIFHAGPFAGGTNNIGEFLALVHGLALLHKQGRFDTPIYSDSRTARAWVRERKVKTKLTPTSANAELFELVERALRWLQTHPVRNPILVWDTPVWGEIPADFGRK